MPRYFFRLEDGTILPDSDGLTLPNAEDAWRTSLGFAGDVLRARRDDLRLGDGWTFTVVEEDKELWRLSFRSEVVPASEET